MGEDAAPVARSLLVFGASGHGTVVADVGRSAGLTLASFLDEGLSRDVTAFCGVPVLSCQAQASFDRAVVALGIGDNAARQRCLHPHPRCEARGADPRPRERRRSPERAAMLARVVDHPRPLSVNRVQAMIRDTCYSDEKLRAASLGCDYRVASGLKRTIP